MRFKQLNINVSYTFWIEKIDTKGLTFKQGDLGQLRLSQYTDALQLVIKGKLFTITLRDPALFNQIASEFGRANANLIEVSRVHMQKDWSQNSVQLELSLASFNGPEIELGTLDIALDQRTLEQAEFNNLGQNFKDVKASLEKSCTLNLTDEPEEQYAIVMLGESALDQLKHIQKSEDQTVSLNQEAQQQIKSGLVLLGDNLQLAIQQFSAVEFDYLGVRKLVTRSQSAPTRTLRLVKVKLKFTEHRAQIASLATQQLSKILADQKGYLSTWDRYGASEGELLLKRARSIGKIEIASYNIGGESGDVMSIYIGKDLRELLTPQDSVLMVSPDTAIPHLDEPDMDWQTFSSRMLEEYKATKGFDSGLSSWEQKVVAENESSDSSQDGLVGVPQGELDQTQSFKVIKVEQHCVVVKNETLPSQNMVLALSILGDQIQIERRMAARSAIVEGKSAMPHLGLLIEEGGILPRGRSQRPTIEPLTNFVENKIFPKNKPTAVQKKAIEIALNTPDIAIIQGPPGTGKTTVITAIIERLNQELDKSKSVQGDILVSGYQHDAVENLLNRLSVNDLPAIKFGQRSGESAQSNSTNIKL
ncbi:AAA domain-containing protein [Photobacterium damselae]|nr:AAA domain-containing protein [Photobacterium damselae]MBE8127759.1 AAA family ATPase [Photobacterium damselae subsp. piscicida]